MTPVAARPAGRAAGWLGGSLSGTVPTQPEEGRGIQPGCHRCCCCRVLDDDASLRRLRAEQQEADS